MQALYVGLLLTVLGIGAVFAFLVLVVWSVEANAKVLARFAHLMPEKETPRRKREAPKPRSPPGQDALAAGART